MKRHVLIRYGMLSGLAVSVIVATIMVTYQSSDRFVSATPSISQRFVSVPSELSLVDLCYHLQNIYGVTSVSYRDYSPRDGSAIVTVFYNPRMTNTREIKIFMRHPHVLWNKPVRT